MRRVVWDVMEETWMLADTTDHLLDQARVHSIFGVTGAAAYVVVCIQLWVHSNHTGLTPGQTCHWTWHDGVSDAAHQLHHSVVSGSSMLAESDFAYLESSDPICQPCQLC